MDNLAHALVAVATTAAVEPNLLKKNPLRATMASAILVNIPDIDFLLNFFGKTFYHFHHRGFTHSFLGLPFMISLAWIFLLLFWRESLHMMKTRRTLIFLLVQIVVGHFLLDYLTSYGVMFFYPLSLERFSWPLMFIIDPIFWLITFSGYFLIRKALKVGSSPQLYGATTGLVVMSWWLCMAFFKQQALALSFDSQHGNAYPGPLAPLSWLVVNEQSGKYHSALVSFFQISNPRVVHQKTHPSYVHGTICKNIKGIELAEVAFLRYQKWATETICYEQDQDHCVCHSMRYAFNLTEQTPYFGTVTIDNQGNIEFMRPDTQKAIDTFFSKIITGDRIQNLD